MRVLRSSGIGSAIACTACESLLDVLQVLVQLGSNDFVNEVCILSRAEDADACTGASALGGSLTRSRVKEHGCPVRHRSAVLYDGLRVL